MPKTQAPSNLPAGFTVETWAGLTPEAQASISALQAKAAAAEAKYTAKPAASVNAEGVRSYGVRVAWPSYLTVGAAEWIVSAEGQASVKAALLALADKATVKALDEKADESLAKREAAKAAKA